MSKPFNTSLSTRLSDGFRRVGCHRGKVHQVFRRTRAQNARMPEVTPTLRESMPPSIGMRTDPSHFSRTSLRIPASSLPRTNPIRLAGENADTSVSPSSTDAKTQNPDSCSSSIARARLVTWTTGTCAAAPAEARNTAAVTGQDRSRGITTPDSPNARAFRRTVPRLWGSVIPSRRNTAVLAGRERSHSVQSEYRNSGISAATPPPSCSPVRRCHSSLAQVRQGTPAASALAAMACLTFPGTESARRTFLGRCKRDERTSSTGWCPVTHMPSCPPRTGFPSAPHLGRKPSRRGDRVGGLRDRPPYHEVVRSVPHRVERGHHPLLVPHRVLRKADSRGDQDGRPPREFPDSRYFPGGAYDPADPLPHRHPGQTHYQVRRRRRKPDLRKVGFVDAREHRDGQDRGPRPPRRLRGAGEHLPSPGGVHRGELDSPRRGGADGPGHRVRDVVELQIEEDVRPRLANLPDKFGPAAGEELHPHLEHPHLPGEGLHDSKGGIRGIGVQRDDDPILHGAHSFFFSCAAVHTRATTSEISTRSVRPVLRSRISAQTAS